MKKIIKIFSFAVLFVFAFFTLSSCSHNSTVKPVERVIYSDEEKIQCESALEEFDDYSISTNESTTYFVGTQVIDQSFLNEIENLSLNDENELINQEITYNFSYDYEENLVTISASLMLDDGSIYLDEIKGVAFYDQDGDIDAVMNVDGESVLLSELRNSGMIQNCGWFKKLIKIAVTAVVTTAVVAAVAAVVVATAGVAAPALVAVGVSTVSASYAAAGIAACAGAIAYCTLGKAMIQSGTAVGEVIGDGLEQVVEKATGIVKVLIITGVEYAVRKLTDAVRYELQDGEYYLAMIGKDENVLYVSVEKVNRTLATWALKLGVSVYNYYSANAYQIAKDAYPSALPQHDYAKVYSNIHGMYFNHWHLGNRSGGHSFYGMPLVY